MLPVSTLQPRHPMPFFVLIKTHYCPLHYTLTDIQ
jgi:hypothetical protein